MNKVWWQAVLHHLIVDLYALHLFYLTAGGEGRVKNIIVASEEVEKYDDDDDDPDQEEEEEEEEEEEDDDDDEEDAIDDLSDLKNVLQSDDEGTENEGWYYTL